MLRIALPNKGRLAEDVRELFDDAGLEVRTAGDRALVASLGGEFEAIFVRAQDVPEFVADGAADAGVTGWDLVRESEQPLEQLLDLEFGACRLVVAAREGSGIASIDDIRPQAGLPTGGGRFANDGPPRVATSFPRLTRRFFAQSGCDVTVVPVSGAAEIAPHLGIADIVVDLTSTGSTLRVNKLQEVATILESSARLVAAGDAARLAQPPALRAAKARHLEELSAALGSVLHARARRYVMANVPRSALDEVRRVLPGLAGPTVVDILDGGTQVAVHAVVPRGAIYRTVADLRAIGATGILVTRIERLMP